MPSPNTNIDDLDNILNDLIEGCFRQFRTDNHTPEDGRIAKTRLQALLSAAKIEELKKLHRAEGNGFTRDYDNITDELIDERIKELEKQ